MGRNSFGRITTRHKGGGNKRRFRDVDFKYEKLDIPYTVKTVEYDPNRGGFIGLVFYKDGEKRYILAPNGLQVGQKIRNGADAPPEMGNCLPLKSIPVGTAIHGLELTPGRGAQVVRAAGGAATLMSRDGGFAQVRLPSGEIRRINEICQATIGQVGNLEHENIILGKAGRSRWIGVRPITRGMARNPVDHPNGGGQGKSKGGGGWQQLTSPWGVLAKGFKTRKKSKPSDRFIVVRRDGRSPKLK